MLRYRSMLIGRVIAGGMFLAGPVNVADGRTSPDGSLSETPAVCTADGSRATAASEVVSELTPLYGATEQTEFAGGVIGSAYSNY